MSEARRRHRWLLWLPALLLVAAGALCFAPLADCPRCTTWNFFEPFETWDIDDLTKPCRVCGGDRRVSIVGRWWHYDPRRSPP